VPSANSSEASVGFYNYTDLTASAAGDMIVDGMNCWVRSGYSIGTPFKQSCLTITSAGAVLIPYNLIVSTDTHLSGNLNITSSNGYIETDNWSDSSTTGMLFQTNSSGKSIGI
jgi:hypothetical protein